MCKGLSKDRPRVGATKRAGFIFIGYGIRKEGVTIRRLRTSFKIQKSKQWGVLGLQNTVRLFRRDPLLCLVEPSARLQGGDRAWQEG